MYSTSRYIVCTSTYKFLAYTYTYINNLLIYDAKYYSLFKVNNKPYGFQIRNTQHDCKFVKII